MKKIKNFLLIIFKWIIIIIKNFRKKNPIKFYGILLFINIILNIIFISWPMHAVSKGLYFHFIKIYWSSKIWIKLVNIGATIFLSSTALFFEWFACKAMRIIKELWEENWVIVIAGFFTWIIISSVMFYANYTPAEFTDNILVYLMTVGALLLVFIPQGLSTLNKTYKYKELEELYDKDRLSIKNANISYFLIIFTGCMILEILITPIFPNPTKIIRFANPININSMVESARITTDTVGTMHYYLFSPLSMPIFHLLSFLYIIIMMLSVLGLIAGFLEIFLILKYFFDYDYKFNKLAVEYPKWDSFQTDWIIRNNLFEYALNKYIIYSIDSFIIKFENFKNINKKKSDVFKIMLNLNKFNGIIEKRKKE